MNLEILTPGEMAACDRAAVSRGPCDGYQLMQSAGSAVADVALARFAAATKVDVLCGPGNNGGDGYVAAQRLAQAGMDVVVWRETSPRPGSDAERCAGAWLGQVHDLTDFRPSSGRLVIDALYGAGLSRALHGAAARAAEFCTERRTAVLAVDLPSGVSGLTGNAEGAAFTALATVTFVRRKPGHLLYPGCARCGEVILMDIGISNVVVADLGVRCFEGRPELWQSWLPTLPFDSHKYERGHAVAFSGSSGHTGAARLSGLAAARIGAGAVTVLSPADAKAENAAHLTSIMLAERPRPDDLHEFLNKRKVAAAIIGPGFGLEPGPRDWVLALAASGKGSQLRGAVIDADAITAFKEAPSDLFEAAANPNASFVMTPHEGEFARLFPDLAADRKLSKIGKALAAAERSRCVIVYKGSDTVIASPDGRSAVNTNGTSLLATAGSGDVLAGMIGGLLAQRVAPFEAACMAVWMHADAARRFGPGLIAEDLPAMLPQVLKALAER